MSQCPQCGAPTTEDQRFCGACGAAVPAPDGPTVQIPAQQPVQEPAREPTQEPTRQPAEEVPPTAQFPAVRPAEEPSRPAEEPSRPAYRPDRPGPPPIVPFADPQAPRVDRSRAPRGNWPGALATAGAAFGVALVLATVVALTGATDLDGSSAIGLTGVLTTATFGADLVQDRGGNGTFTIGQYPLLATVLALGVAVAVFRRATAGVTSIRSALADAARAGLVLSVLLTLLALLVRVARPDIRGYRGSDGESLATTGLVVQNGPTVSSIAGALILGFLVLFTVLAIATLAFRREWTSPVAYVLHGWLRAPLRGIVVLLASLMLCGVFYVVAILAGVDSTRDLPHVIGLFAVLPALGLRVLALGSLAPVGTESSIDGEEEVSFARLGDFAADHGGLFWLAPLLVLATAAAATYVVARSSSERRWVRRDVLVHLGLLLVVLPFLIRFANLHTGGELAGDGRERSFSSFGGVEGLQTTVFYVLLSALVAVALLLLGGHVDARVVLRRSVELARRVRAPGTGSGASGPSGESGQSGPSATPTGAPTPARSAGPTPPPGYRPSAAPGQGSPYGRPPQ
ncbi:zinc ribbon domain-containing protein [Nocardioides donggukensis]|uniref:Zinc-ribbon domain-containing protein n=1 Tax=Nocardioides donggukensis TaxID=2774019 RepID=A0A927K7P2_9ACTN|nr:zinc ribbon domain-containing protein [Nocardioides donggukensis]MBD8869185.1 hypothetical protein [Nocardioides donggukensis]